MLRGIWRPKRPGRCGTKRGSSLPEQGKQSGKHLRNFGRGSIVGLKLCEGAGRPARENFASSKPNGTLPVGGVSREGGARPGKEKKGRWQKSRTARGRDRRRPREQIKNEDVKRLKLREMEIVVQKSRQPKGREQATLYKDFLNLLRREKNLSCKRERSRLRI